MPSILDFPAEVLDVVLHSFLEDVTIQGTSALSKVHPAFANGIKRIRFGPRHEWGLACLRRLRDVEIGPGDGEETEDDVSQTSYPESEHSFVSDVSSVRSLCQIWSHDRMAKLMEANLPYMLSHVRVFSDPSRNICHPFVPTYLDASLDFLMRFWNEKMSMSEPTLSQRREEKRHHYKNQLCQALYSAHPRNSIAYFLCYGFQESNFNIDDDIWTSDPGAMFAAAAAVGSLSAMNWVCNYMRGAVPVDTIPSSASSSMVVIPSWKMALAAQRYSKGQRPSLVKATELFGTPFEAATANGHVGLASMLFEQLKADYTAEEVRSQLQVATYRSRHKNNGTMYPILLDWYIESGRPNITRETIRMHRKDAVQYSVSQGHIEALYKFFSDLGLLSTRPVEDRYKDKSLYSHTRKEEFTYKLELLWKACQFGHGHIVRFLHAMLKDQFRPFYLRRYANHGLRQAVIANWLHAAQVLLDMQADVNHVLDLNLRPTKPLLQVARMHVRDSKLTSMSLLLIKNGADTPKSPEAWADWRRAADIDEDLDEPDMATGIVDVDGMDIWPEYSKAGWPVDAEEDEAKRGRKPGSKFTVNSVMEEDHEEMDVDDGIPARHVIGYAVYMEDVD
jgi:hypothetical protein